MLLGRLLFCWILILSSSFKAQASNDNAWLTYYVNLTNSQMNEDPVALDDTASVSEDGALSSINVLFNDTDLDSDPLRVFEVTAEFGLVSINSDSTLTYEAAANFNGIDNIVYRITDEKGGIAEALLMVTIIAVNDTPVITDDRAVVLMGSTNATIDALSNDNDVDGDPLTITSASAPSGSVSINPDNTLSYTPQVGVTGVVTIEYQIGDGSVQSDAGTVSVFVVPDTAPVILSQSALSIDEDQMLTMSLTFFDIVDVDSADFTLRVENGHKYQVFNGVTIRPVADYYGLLTVPVIVSDGVNDSVVFDAVVEVVSVNDAPRNPYTSIINVAQDTSKTMYTGGWFYDPEAALDPTLYAGFNYDFRDGNSNSFVGGKTFNGLIERVSCDGIASSEPRHCFKYTPDPGFTGDDIVQYHIFDEQGAMSTRGGITFRVVPVLPAEWVIPVVIVGQPITLQNAKTTINRCESKSPAGYTATVTDGVAVFTSASSGAISGWQCFEPLNTTPVEDFTSPLLIKNSSTWSQSNASVGQSIRLNNVYPGTAYCRPEVTAEVSANTANALSSAVVNDEVVFEHASATISSWQCFNSSDELLETFTSALRIDKKLAWSKSSISVGEQITVLEAGDDQILCRASDNHTIKVDLSQGKGKFYHVSNGVITDWHCKDSQGVTTDFSSPLNIIKLPATTLNVDDTYQ